MAKIRMKKTAAGPDGAFSIGTVHDVDGETASALVSAGSAEWAERPVERAVTAPTETREASEPDEAVDVSGMTKAELVEEAERRGIEVVRSDGGDGDPLKSDYIEALGG